MKFSNVEGEKVVASPGARGSCPWCESEMIARCGERKIWHWAHKGRRSCDPWWENETEWHREWKDNFPSAWQEYVQYDDQSGEKHIADVKAEHGLVIEFQHSYLKPQERIARESFYRKMVWVVDGARLKRDYPRFRRGMEDAKRGNNNGLYLVYFPDECFPRNWLDSSVPVFFDFRNADTADPNNKLHKHLWCLLPGYVGGHAMVVAMSNETFVETTSSGPKFLKFVEFIREYAQKIRRRRAESARLAERGSVDQVFRRRQKLVGRRRNIRL